MLQRHTYLLGTPFGQTDLDCCAGQNMVTTSQGCCEGLSIYDLATQTCCNDGNGTIGDATGSNCPANASNSSFENCNGVAFDATTQACCDQQIYDLATHRCCNGVTIYVPDMEECCHQSGAGVTVTIEIHACCDGSDPYSKLFFGCCNGVIYSLQNQGCCGDGTGNVFDLDTQTCVFDGSTYVVQ